MVSSQPHVHDPSITLYGLKTCDTCKKAIKLLTASGRTVTFVDVRAEADLAAKVPEWLQLVGSPMLINTRSTTWRSLSPADKERAETDATGLLIANPALVKRPVIEDADNVHVGWSPSVQAALGV